MSAIRNFPPVVVKVCTAARMLDCSRQHVLNLVSAGELRRVTLGNSRAVRIPVEDVYRVAGLAAPTTEVRS